MEYLLDTHATYEEISDPGNKNVKGGFIIDLGGCDDAGKKCCVTFIISDEIGGGTAEVCGNMDWYLSLDI